MTSGLYANLRAMLAPRTVAVIGATERPGSVGHVVFSHLTSRGFTGSVWPVTPTHASVQGKPAVATIADVPGPVDLAVIVTPAPTVPGIVRQCGRAGVKGAIIISAGFRETGAAGAELERQIFEDASSSGMRIIGPNCLGAIVPGIGLDATFAAATARPGTIGFVSQSGALCTAILDWAYTRNIGFSHFISAGSMVDVAWSDYLDFLVDDSGTKSIILYMESVGRYPSGFVSALREAAALKPVIVMKSGRSDVAARAAASHTGALLGDDGVFDAALRRCGALRVDSIEDLFDMADVLAKGKRPAGKRLAIVTNAGGPGVIASDALLAGGGELARLSAESTATLDRLLPSYWSGGDPIDIFGDADAARYAKAVDVARADPDVDAVLVIYAPQAIANSVQIADALIGAAGRATKPVLAAWMGGAGVAAGMTALEGAGFPTYSYPEPAVAAFNHLWHYDENLRALYETPSLGNGHPFDRAAVAGVIDAALRSGRRMLGPEECAMMARAYGIPVLDVAEAATADDAVAAADAVGYPVAVKLRSKTITHKTDVGGVRLDVPDAAGVRAAFEGIRSSVTAHVGAAAFDGVVVQRMSDGGAIELILGSAIDAQFGPVIVFGLGGTYVEVFHDRAIGLPPLNATSARRLMERTRAYAALGNVRGRGAVDVDALAAILVGFSALIVDHPRVREIDLNPLRAAPDGIVALDMRVILHGADVPDAALPRPVIRPYPAEYAGSWTSPDGEHIDIRPIRAEDEGLVRDFHRTLSEDTVYMRFAHLVGLDARIAHARLARSCFVDYGREIALVAQSRDDAAQRVLAIGNLVRTRSRGEAEFALLVADDHQRHGLGTELLRRLIAIARAEGIDEIVGYVLAGNTAMLTVCAHLGFTKDERLDDPLARVRLRVR